MTNRRRSLRLWVVAIGRGVAIFAISLALGEAALRAYDYFHPMFVFYDNSYNRFRGRPGAPDWDFTLNSLGFKDVEFSIDKDDRTYRILGLGDSFAFGVVPYAHNYLTLLEERLEDAAGGRRVEVLNMGIPSIGPRQYLSMLVREGLAYDPDLVLVSFFVGNDFIESDRGGRRRPLWSYSYVLSLLRYAATVRPKYEGQVIHAGETYCDDCPAFSRDTYLEIERDRSFLYLVGDERFQRLLEDAVFYLRELRDVCRRRGMRLVVVVIPDEIQLDEALRREVAQRFYVGLAERRWDLGRPARELAAALDELAIEHLDLHPAFAREAERRALYRPQDSHWNIAGNRLAADEIAGFLRASIAELGGSG